MVFTHANSVSPSRRCLPPRIKEAVAADASSLDFRSPMYFNALVQKVAWANAVVDTGTTVLWMVRGRARCRKQSETNSLKAALTVPPLA